MTRTKKKPATTPPTRKRDSRIGYIQLDDEFAIGAARCSASTVGADGAGYEVYLDVERFESEGPLSENVHLFVQCRRFGVAVDGQLARYVGELENSETKQDLQLNEHEVRLLSAALSRAVALMDTKGFLPAVQRSGDAQQA